MVRRYVVVAAAVGLVLVALAVTAVAWFATSDTLRRAVEREAGTRLGVPVRVGSVSAVFLPRPALRVTDVRIGDPPTSTTAVATVSAPIRSLMAGRLDRADLVLDDMAFPGWDRDVLASAEASIQGTRLTVTSLVATVGDVRLEATGTIELEPRLDAALSIRADALDLNELVAVATAFLTRAAGGSPPAGEGPSRLSLTLSAPHGRVAGLEIARVDAGLNLDGRTLRVEPLTFDVFGGRFLGSVALELGDETALELRGRVANLDAARLTAANGTPPLVGRVHGSGRFAGQGRDLAAALASLRGVGEIVVADGAVAGLDLVSPALRFLDERDPAVAGVPTGFDDLTATFALADGAVRSEDLHVRSPQLDAFVRGTLELRSRALSATVDLVLSDELSMRTGLDFLRFARAGSRIVVPASIGGTLGQPVVAIDVAAALRSGARTDIERRLETVTGFPPAF